MPEVVFFDAVGTLFGIRGSVGGIYAKAADAFGIRVDPTVLDQAFYKTFGAAPAAAFPGVSRLDLAEKAWWRRVVQGSLQEAGIRVEQEFAQFELYFEQMYELFATADPWQVYEETLEVLSQWQQRGSRLGIISNFDTRLYRVLRALDLDEFFLPEQIILSTRVGAAKPDRRVFEVALSQQGVTDAAKALHIGDSLRQDYQGAVQAGLQGLWLNREQPQLQIPDMIGSLRESLPR